MLTIVNKILCYYDYHGELKPTYDLAWENLPREVSLTTVCVTKPITARIEKISD